MSEQLGAIYSATEYIEECLQEEITVADIAAAAGYSLYHFIRVFNQTVLHTPYNYLIRRRLSQAALALVQTKRRIIDIAVDYCFNSPEVFSRAFLRMFGEQPSKYRSIGQADPKFLFPPRTIEHLEFLQDHQILPPTFVERDIVHVSGLMTRIDKDRYTIDQLWNTLGDMLLEKQGRENVSHYGITLYPKDWVESGVFYMAAVEGLDADDPALVSRALPAGGYACFRHEATEDAVDMLRAEIYQTWLPKSSKRIAVPLEIDVYGDLGYLPNCPRLIYIPII
jgi:AraC family transcriptional regulator